MLSASGQAAICRLADVHAGAIAESRRIKPAIPELGNFGIPIRDEIEMDKRLQWAAVPYPDRAATLLDVAIHGVDAVARTGEQPQAPSISEVRQSR